MLVAFCDQLFGNSTPRCSKAGLSGLPITASRISHSISSKGCVPARGKSPLDREALQTGFTGGWWRSWTSNFSSRSDFQGELRRIVIESDRTLLDASNSANAAEISRLLYPLMVTIWRCAGDGRAGHRRRDAAERATAAQRPRRERASAAKEVAADAIAAVKPKLRGVSHEWAFFVSLFLGAGADRRREDAEGDPRGRHLRGQPLRPARHQRPLPPGQLDPAQRAPLDAPARPLDDLLPHRRHLHALRAAGPARAAGRAPSSSSSGSARSPAPWSRWSGSTTRNGSRR